MAIFSNFSDPTHPFLEVFHAVNLLCTLRPRASDKGPTSKLPNLLIGWEMCLAARRLIGFLCVACTVCAVPVPCSTQSSIKSSSNLPRPAHDTPLFAREIVDLLRSLPLKDPNLLIDMLSHLHTAWKAQIDLKQCWIFESQSLDRRSSTAIDETKLLQEDDGWTTVGTRSDVTRRKVADSAVAERAAKQRWEQDCRQLVAVAETLTQKYDLAVNPLSVFPEWGEESCATFL